jgi:hypothetical protein
MLAAAESPVRVFNESLRPDIAQRLSQRKEKLGKDDAFVTSMGIKLKRRDDPIILPTKRKPLPLPVGTAGEPHLEMQAYEDVLAVCAHMAKVMERSPTSFAKLNEEDIRWVLLVALNGVYEGKATGETFNFHGKTDILIREADRNLFIAECKLWTGPKHFKSAIDQLLGYTCWRDTKAAILVFNRRRNLTAVLDAIRDSLRNHPNVVGSVSDRDDTGVRCVVHHRDDKDRHITLSVLVFEVPAR